MDNVISLGFFCSPALELQRMNLRRRSFPFDWLITPSLEVVMELIDNHFEDFTEERYFYQHIQNSKYYRNVKYNIDFYHDFDNLKSFKSQIKKVSEKYSRRIERFYETIKQPTLFIRYIHSQDEIDYIERDYDQISGKLKHYNSENEIIFVANNGLVCHNSEVKIWYAEVDAGDIVARKFLDKNDDLMKYISDKTMTIKKDTFFSDVPGEKSFIEKQFRKACARMNIYYRHNQRI